MYYSKIKYLIIGMILGFLLTAAFAYELNREATTENILHESYINYYVNNTLIAFQPDNHIEVRYNEDNSLNPFFFLLIAYSLLLTIIIKEDEGTFKF